MEFTDLLKGLGKKLGLDLVADENGSCVLGVDDTMRITIQSIDEVGAICIWGEIGAPPPYGLEGLLSAMLNANHLFRGTGGSTISRDSDTGAFFLCRCDPLAVLDVESFSAKLEKFVNTLEAWQKLISDYRPALSDSTPKKDDFQSLGSSEFIAV